MRLAGQTVRTKRRGELGNVESAKNADFLRCRRIHLRQVLMKRVLGQLEVIQTLMRLACRYHDSNQRLPPSCAP